MKKLAGLTILPLLGAAVLTNPAIAAETINGAGATFPAPIYQKWFGEYKASHPNVQINYQAIGSGGGITQLQKGTVDFGASDMPMTDDQIKATQGKASAFPDGDGRGGAELQHPGRDGEAEFSPEAIAGIYLGKIRNGTTRKSRPPTRA